LKKKIRPIFILGSARNGTTWLANVLCNHSEIIGAQHEVHWGIHESKIYENLHYWGNLKNDRNFIKFIELYSSADYFQLVEGDKNYFYSHHPQDFIEFFFTLMDQYTEKKKVSFWITKLDPNFYLYPKEFNDFLRRVEARYPNYILIGIKRDFESVFPSYLRMKGVASQNRMALFIRELLILLEGSRYFLHYHSINKIIQEKNGITVNFNEFREHKEKIVKKICHYLSLKYEPDMIRDKFKPNSSFLSRKGKNQWPILKYELKWASILIKVILPKIPHLALALVK